MKMNIEKKQVNYRRVIIRRSGNRTRQMTMKAFRTSQGWTRLELWLPIKMVDRFRIMALQEAGHPPTECHLCHQAFVDDLNAARRSHYFYCSVCRIEVDKHREERQKKKKSSVRDTTKFSKNVGL